MKALSILSRLAKEIESGELYDEVGELIVSTTSIKEAIAELESLQNRTCESCKYYSESFYDGSKRSDPICTCQDSNCNDIFVSRDFCCSRYEPKDDQ